MSVTGLLLKTTWIDAFTDNEFWNYRQWVGLPDSSWPPIGVAVGGGSMVPDPYTAPGYVRWNDPRGRLPSDWTIFEAWITLGAVSDATVWVPGQGSVCSVGFELQSMGPYHQFGMTVNQNAESWAGLGWGGPDLDSVYAGGNPITGYDEFFTSSTPGVIPNWSGLDSPVTMRINLTRATHSVFTATIESGGVAVWTEALPVDDAVMAEAEGCRPFGHVGGGRPLTAYEWGWSVTGPSPLEGGGTDGLSHGDISAMPGLGGIVRDSQPMAGIPLTPGHF